jgi:outer membrane scaffolding protein for murein synthesis (MipA/OmpV family)
VEYLPQKSAAWLMSCLFSLVVFTGPALAAGDVLDEARAWNGMSEEIDEAEVGADGEVRQRKWALSIGLNGGVSPDYEGSNDYQFKYGPHISASWRDVIFLKGKTLGVNLIREQEIRAGMILTSSPGRNEDDNDKLEGLGDVDGSREVGAFVTYRQKPWRFRSELRRDISSGHEGTLLKLSGGSAMPLTKSLVFFELGTTWASGNYMDSFFSVDQGQSASSGLPEYKAEAGIKDVSLRITSGYRITRHWRIGAALEFKRLMGDAAGSPIVDDKYQFLAGFNISYHMGSAMKSKDPPKQESKTQTDE